MIVSEADFQRAVIDLARTLGHEVYHVPDSRRATCPGFPDLTILGRGGVLMRELKTEKGRLSADQLRWLGGLAASGIDAAVWRPTDLRSGRVQAEMREIR